MLGAWPLASAASRGGKSREAAGRGNAVIESSPALPSGRCFLLPRLPFQWDPTFTKDAGRKTALMRSLGEEEEGSGLAAAKPPLKPHSSEGGQSRCKIAA